MHPSSTSFILTCGRTLFLAALLSMGQPSSGLNNFGWRTTRPQSSYSARAVLPTLVLPGGVRVPYSPLRRHYHRSMLAVASAAPKTDCHEEEREEETSTAFSATTTTSTSSTMTQVQNANQRERFHSDMLRVLSSRTDRGIAALALQSVEERRQRPDILEHDKDGVQRVMTMLDRMVKMGLATEETFQIAMRACLQRGRLRWRNHHPDSSNSYNSNNNNNNYKGPPEASQQQQQQHDGTLPVICAADQIESLLGQLEAITSDISLETFALVLEAYATCSTPRGGKYYARKADALLERMEERGMFGATSVEDMDQEDSIPVELLAHVLHAWAWQQANMEDGDCAARANDYLDQIERSQPKPSTDVLLQCYDWVLEAWSKSGSTGSSERANQVFLKMKELNQTQSTSTILDTQTYSNAILARSKCKEPGSAQQAHDLLVEMLTRFEQGAFPSSSEPELIAFNGVITAWARNGEPTKAEEVLWLLDGIRSKCKNLVPDVVTYNSVLHSHVMSLDRKEALNQIRNLVDFMEANCEEQPAICPDSFTYNTLMKVNFYKHFCPDACL